MSNTHKNMVDALPILYTRIDIGVCFVLSTGKWTMIVALYGQCWYIDSKGNAYMVDLDDNAVVDVVVDRL